MVVVVAAAAVSVAVGHDVEHEGEDAEGVDLGGAAPVVRLVPLGPMIMNLTHVPIPGLVLILILIQIARLLLIQMPTMTFVSSCLLLSIPPLSSWCQPTALCPVLGWSFFVVVVDSEGE